MCFFFRAVTRKRPKGKIQLEELKFSGDTHQQFGPKNRPFVPNGKDRLPTIRSQVPD